MTPPPEPSARQRSILKRSADKDETNQSKRPKQTNLKEANAETAIFAESSTPLTTEIFTKEMPIQSRESNEVSTEPKKKNMKKNLLPSQQQTSGKASPKLETQATANTGKNHPSQSQQSLST